MPPRRETRRGRDVGREMLDEMQGRGGFLRACAKGAYEVERLDTALCPKDRVRVRGLVAKSEYNGRSANVVETLANGRVAIVLDAGGKELSVRQESLEPLVERWVPLAGACTELSPGSVLRLRWRDPKQTHAAAAAAAAAALNETLQGAAGTLTFPYYDPAALAMELHIVASRRDLNQHKILDRGLQYLAGEEHYFCSAVLNFALSGSVAPPLPATAQIKTWGDSVPYRFLEMFMQQLQRAPPASGSVCSVDLTGLHQTVRPERNQVFVLTLSRDRYALSEREFPWDGEALDSKRLPTRKEEIPDWWRRAVEPWDGALRRMFDGAGEPSSLPCMFFGNEDGAGCHVHQVFPWTVGLCCPSIRPPSLLRCSSSHLHTLALVLACNLNMYQLHLFGLLERHTYVCASPLLTLGTRTAEPRTSVPLRARQGVARICNGHAHQPPDLLRLPGLRLAALRRLRQDVLLRQVPPDAGAHSMRTLRASPPAHTHGAAAAAGGRRDAV